MTVRSFEKTLQWIFGSLPGRVGNTLRRYVYSRLFACAGRIDIDPGVTIVGFGNISFKGAAVLRKGVVLDARKGEIVLGDGFVANDYSKLETRSRGRIEIGGNCVLRSYTLLVGGDLTIGDNFFANRRSVLHSTESLVAVGDDVLLGHNCIVVDTLHGYKNKEIPIREQALVARPVRIGSDVWLASNSVINAGVSVGQGSVAAAGAVVTKDVDPYTVVGGVPARVVGRRE